MIIETWSFPQFDCAPSEDGLSNVVKAIHWRFDIVDGPYNAGAYGSVGLDAPSPDGYTPFEALTEEWAIGVVSAKVDVAQIRAALEGEIEKKRNPPVVPMQPPFG